MKPLSIVPSPAPGPDLDVYAHQAGLQLDALAALLAQIPRDAVAQVAACLHALRVSGNTVYLMGNGGSATTSLHMACDLQMAAADHPTWPPLRAFSLNANMAVFSAAANDEGYANAFVAQLRSVLQPGDALLGISASGSSPNCVEAMGFARAQGATTLALLGFDGGEMLAMADRVIHVPSFDYGLVEDTHTALSHALARCLRQP